MRFKITALAALGLLFAEPAAAADAEGVWLSPVRSAHIQIMHCGEALCGRILSATSPTTNPHFLDVHNKDPALRGRSMIGQIFINGFTGGPPRWTGGWLYNPKDGRTYRGSITLIDGDHLKLEGCAVWPLCQSQILTRLD